MLAVPAPEVIVPPLTLQEYPAPTPADGTDAMMPLELGHTMAGVVMVALGKAFTVSTAAPDSALPQALVKSARNRFPLSAKFAANVYVPLVAPAMFVKVTPPSPLACHWAVGAGLPLADAVKETELPAHTALFAGLDVATGAALIVTVALPEPELEQLASLT